MDEGGWIDGGEVDEWMLVGGWMGGWVGGWMDAWMLVGDGGWMGG